MLRFYTTCGLPLMSYVLGPPLACSAFYEQSLIGIITGGKGGWMFTIIKDPKR